MIRKVQSEDKSLFKFQVHHAVGATLDFPSLQMELPVKTNHT